MRGRRCRNFTLIELVAVTVILMIAVGMSSAVLRSRAKKVSDFDDTVKELQSLCSGARVQAMTLGRERVLYFNGDQNKFLIGDPPAAEPLEGELYLKGPLKDVPEYDDDVAAREAEEEAHPQKPPAELTLTLGENFTFAVSEMTGMALQWRQLLDKDAESNEKAVRSEHLPDLDGQFTTMEGENCCWLFRFFPDGSGEAVHPFELTGGAETRYFTLSPLFASLIVQTAAEREENDRSRP